MSQKLKVVVVVGVCLLALVAVFYSPNLDMAEPKRASITIVHDLSEHPIYSKYVFGETDNVIDFGIQPLWIPTSVISEAMKRDVVLRKALSEEGLKIRFHSFLKGADVNFFLQRGDLEVGIGGDMPALTATSTSRALVAALIQQGFCSLVAGRHILIKELKGKRIAYPFGSIAHYSLLRALSSAGLTEGDVRLVPLDVTEMPDGLNRGKIDAFSAWEPTPTIGLTRFPGQVIIHRSLSSGYLYFSPDFADRHPDALRLITASEVRALNWLGRWDKNLLEASRWTMLAGQALSGQKSVLSAKQYVALAKDDLLGIPSVGAIPANDLKSGGRLFQEFKFLKRLGKISASVSWDEVMSRFDQSVIEEVASTPEKYQLRTYEYQDDGNETN